MTGVNIRLYINSPLYRLPYRQFPYTSRYKLIAPCKHFRHVRSNLSTRYQDRALVENWNDVVGAGTGLSGLRDGYAESSRSTVDPISAVYDWG